MSPSLRKSMRIESFTIIRMQNLRKRKRHRTPGADGRSNSDTFLHRPERCVCFCVIAASLCLPPTSARLSSLCGHLLLLLLQSPPFVSATETLLASHLQSPPLSSSLSHAPLYHPLVFYLPPFPSLLLPPLLGHRHISLGLQRMALWQESGRGPKLWLQPNPRLSAQVSTG